jgi:ribosomal protein S18 acetylase RimI-like enzyme
MTSDGLVCISEATGRDVDRLVGIYRDGFGDVFRVQSLGGGFWRRFFLELLDSRAYRILVAKATSRVCGFSVLLLEPRHAITEKGFMSVGAHLSGLLRLAVDHPLRFLGCLAARLRRVPDGETVPEARPCEDHRGSKYAWLQILAVDPHRQGQGFGSALVRHSIRLATSYGCHEVRVCVLASNSRALRLYRHLGFVPISEGRGRVVCAVDCLRGDDGEDRSDAGPQPHDAARARGR